MILLDFGRKRYEMKHVWRAKRKVLICFICCALKVFRETAMSIIVILLADEGMGIIKELMVNYRW